VISYLVATPDGRRLITASGDGVALVTEATTGETVAGPFRHGGYVRHVVLSADGNRAATAGLDGAARGWGAKTRKPSAPPLHQDRAVPLVASSPDGGWLAPATADDRIHLWDAATGEPLGGDLQPWRGGAAVKQLAFGKDGQLVAAHGQPGDPRGRHT